MKTNLVSKIRIKVIGKNNQKFINKLINAHIELLDIKYVKMDRVYIWIYKKDYPKVYKIKKIYNYDIDIVDASGWIKIRKEIYVNKYLIFSCIIGLACLIILTNLIFEVEVISNNKDVRDFINYELRIRGIEKYSFKKNYKELNKIKEDILLNYKDKIEWMEIEEVGVKYVIRIQLREIISPNDKLPNRDVVAAKDATIKKIVAEKGQVIRSINSYVKKGETIISGLIKLNDSEKGLVPATGKVYGEVWYNMTVEYPFTYYEENYSSEEKKFLVFKFLNFNLSIPNSTSYKKTDEFILLRNDLIPLKLSIETKQKVKIIDQVLTEDEAIEHAIALARNKMEKELNDDEYIISQKNLKINVKDSKIVLETFFVVYEDITDYKEITITSTE